LPAGEPWIRDISMDGAGAPRSGGCGPGAGGAGSGHRADLDPPTAHDLARTRKTGGGRRRGRHSCLRGDCCAQAGTSRGFTSGSVLLVLLLVCHVALRWFGGPSIRRGGRFAGRKGSWRSAGARRTAASCDPLRCGVTSAVGSSCASPMVRRSRCCWDDRPACRSPTPSPASGTVVDRLPQFGTHSERGSHEKDHRLDDGVHRRVLRGA